MVLRRINWNFMRLIFCVDHLVYFYVLYKLHVFLLTSDVPNLLLCK